MFTVTNAWLMQHQSRRDAWTADQLAAIGISWPPKHGWKHRVIGTTITDQQKARFEQALRARAARGAATVDMFG
jgi:hypothetical protein